MRLAALKHGRPRPYTIAGSDIDSFLTVGEVSDTPIRPIRSGEVSRRTDADLPDVPFPVSLRPAVRYIAEPSTECTARRSEPLRVPDIDQLLALGEDCGLGNSGVATSLVDLTGQTGSGTASTDTSIRRAKTTIRNHNHRHAPSQPQHGDVGPRVKPGDQESMSAIIKSLPSRAVINLDKMDIDSFLHICQPAVDPAATTTATSMSSRPSESALSEQGGVSRRRSDRSAVSNGDSAGAIKSSAASEIKTSGTSLDDNDTPDTDSSAPSTGTHSAAAILPTKRTEESPTKSPTPLQLPLPLLPSVSNSATSANSKTSAHLHFSPIQHTFPVAGSGYDIDVLMAVGEEEHSQSMAYPLQEVDLLLSAAPPPPLPLQRKQPSLVSMSQLQSLIRQPGRYRANTLANLAGPLNGNPLLGHQSKGVPECRPRSSTVHVDRDIDGVIRLSDSLQAAYGPAIQAVISDHNVDVKRPQSTKIDVEFFMEIARNSEDSFKNYRNVLNDPQYSITPSDLWIDSRRHQGSDRDIEHQATLPASVISRAWHSNDNEGMLVDHTAVGADDENGYRIANRNQVGNGGSVHFHLDWQDSVQIVKDIEDIRVTRDIDSVLQDVHTAPKSASATGTSRSKPITRNFRTMSDLVPRFDSLLTRSQKRERAFTESVLGPLDQNMPAMQHHSETDVSRSKRA